MRCDTVDISRGAFLPYFMRPAVFIGLTLLLPVFAVAQEPAVNHSPQPRNQLPAPSAEPDNVQAYGPPLIQEDETPSSADLGPAQRPFVLATLPDKIGLQDNPPTVNNEPPDKLALDKRVRISLIHDVENDTTYNGAENHALVFETTYLNWGAVTAEQLQARRGHYFTNSWTNHGPRADFIARFEYREVKSGGLVRMLVQPMPHVKGTVRSYFAVVGRAYLAYGPVASWRFSILRGDTVVAQARSFIW
jgi:hypothetical protein